MSELAHSLARLSVARLVEDLGPEGARTAIRAICAKFTRLELAAIGARWQTWARPKQIAPIGEWRSWGFLCGRGYGKTRSIAEHVNEEVEAKRCGSLGLCAQNEDKSIEIHIEGPTGLIKTAPPWFRPQWEAKHKQLVWPNGARAYVRSPEAAGTIRSGEHHLSWLSEIQSWPHATREEAFLNFQFATRVGYARTVWDATPKKRHPILLRLLEAAKNDPLHHRIVRGSMRENAANLGSGVVDHLFQQYSGTTQGREELDGEMLDDDDDALVKQDLIDDNRRAAPALARCAIGVDPAVTTNKGSDRTGISLAGLGVDGRAYVLGDFSGKHGATAWGTIVLDLYVQRGCDLVVVETNKGGNLLTQNLRALSERRRMTVVVVDEKWVPHREANVVFVREIFSRGEKADRARPLATAYEAGRVSHVPDVDLAALEAILTTWVPVPGSRSPDPLDALVSVVTELLGLRSELIDPSFGFKGITELAAALAAMSGHRTDPAAIASLLRRGDGGGRI